MSRKWEVRLAWFLFFASLVLWPVSILTWAKDEPPTTLGLSWLAITFIAVDYLKSSRVHRDQGQDG